MKLSAQEEYGVRCLLRIARAGEGGSRTIPEISQAERISEAYAAKLLRLLRRGGFVQSLRGKVGGYTLSRPPEEIVLGPVLAWLGGRLYESDFCDRYPGEEIICTHSVDCSIRSVWRVMQVALDQVLNKTTLKDLVRNEQQMSSWVNQLVTLPKSGGGSGPLPKRTM